MSLEKLFEDIKGKGGKARDLSIDPVKFREAARASQRLPQAVMKISSYSKGKDKAMAHSLYIGRNGKEELEDPTGATLKTAKEIKERLAEWSTDFDTRKNSRDTVNIVLSSPQGTDPGKVENSVRQFAKKHFAENHDYLFAIHTDTKNPHGHLMVKMRGHDGQKLDLGKKELLALRKSYAEVLRQNGVEVDTSPRLARGVGQKAKKLPHKKMEEKGISPYKVINGEKVDIKKSMVKAVVSDLSEGKKQSDKPWAVAAKKKTAEVKSDYQQIAQVITEVGKSNKNKDLESLGKQIGDYAKSIPEPQTKAETVEAKIQQHQKSSSKDIER